MVATFVRPLALAVSFDQGLELQKSIRYELPDNSSSIKSEVTIVFGTTYDFTRKIPPLTAVAPSVYLSGR